MTQQELMTLLKIDLGIIGTAYDPQLEQLLSAAQSFITREGVTLTDSAEDAQIIIMYSA